MTILKKLGINLTLNIEEDTIPEPKEKEMQPLTTNDQVSFAKLLELESINDIVCLKKVDGNHIALTNIYNIKLLYSSRNTAALPSIINPKQSSSDELPVSFDFADAIENQHLSSVPCDINKYDLIGILENDLTISFGLVVNSDNDGICVYKIQVDKNVFQDTKSAIHELKMKSHTMMYIIDNNNYETFSTIYSDITRYDFHPRDHRKITNYILFNVSMSGANDHEQLELFVRFVKDLISKHSNSFPDQKVEIQPEEEEYDSSLVADFDNDNDVDMEPTEIIFDEEQLKEEDKVISNPSGSLSPSSLSIMDTEELEEEHPVHTLMDRYMRKQAKYIEKNMVPGGEITLNKFLDLQDDLGEFKSPKTLRNELKIVGAYIRRKEKDEFNRAAAMRNIALLDFALLKAEQRYNKRNNDEDN